MRLSAGIPWLMLIVGTGTAGAEIEDFVLGQAVQTGRTSVSAYIDVWDESRDAVDDLPITAVSATLGGETLRVDSLTPFRDSGEGVAYVFAVDISRSLSAEQFAGIRGALETWFERLGPLDQVALLSFGDESRVVVDYTEDRQALSGAVAELGPTDGTTVLYRAIRDAVELSSRRDPGLPRRRALVVLSDGLDEGSGMTADDVLVLLRDQRLPVYSIGFGGPSRQESLDLMLRFSTNSGGRFVAVEGSDFATAYSAVREAIERVWVAALGCPTCTADGSSYRFQLNLELADRVLSKGLDIRLLPPVGGAPQPEPAETEVVEAALVPRESPASGGLDARWLGGGAAAVLALVAAFVVGSRRRGAAPAQGVAKKKTRKKMNRRERKLNEVPLEAAPLVPAVALRLEVVRGQEAGREYRFLLRSHGVMGSGKRSDFKLDEDVASEQLELRQDSGTVTARNISRTDPTLLNGGSLEEARALKNGDLLGNGSFIAKVALG